MTQDSPPFVGEGAGWNVKLITFTVTAILSVSGGVAGAAESGAAGSGMPAGSTGYACLDCGSVPVLVESDPARGGHWMDAGGSGTPAYTIGYAWRQLIIERSAFARSDRDTLNRRDPLRSDSSSTRLSYRPLPGWSFQISRGNLGGLDQVNPADETRRTSISATYSRPLRHGDWQTTFAWGRSVHANREPSVGYLVESTARMAGTDAMFARLEQVRSDELVRQTDSMQRELFKLRKLTLGYYRDMQASGSVSVDIGAVASRYFVPAVNAPSYGSEPTTYMLFMRLKLR